MRLIVVLLCLVSFPGYAFSKQDNPASIPEMPPLPKAREGAVPWQLFLTTQEKHKRVNFPSGGYAFEATPIFSDKLKALNGKEVVIHGFMFPLEQAEKQSSFLIGPFPPSCPFHYHVPPTLIVEVKAAKPLAFSWDEVTMKGKLELVEKDSNGIYYYLRDAVNK